MAAQRQDAFFRIQGFKGQLSAFNAEEMPPGKSVLNYNGFVHHQVFNKLPGSSSYINSSYGTDPIRFLRSFNYRLIYQIATNLIYETAEGSGAESLISSSVDSSTFRADEWRGRLYLANGVDLKYFNGTSLEQLGILPPGAGKTPRESLVLAGTAGFGGVLPSGSYDYVYTFYDTNTETESLPYGALVGADGLFISTEYSSANPLGWYFTTVSLGSTGKITFSILADQYARIIKTRPARANLVNVYRRDPGQSDFRLSFTFDPAAQDFIIQTDNTPLASLGAILDVSQLTPPPTREAAINAGASEATGPKYVRTWRDSLWLLGAQFPQFTVSDSFTGASVLNQKSSSILHASDAFQPDYYPFNYECGFLDGQKPTGLAVAGDTLCIFKERSIYTVLGTSLDNYVVKIKDSRRGCSAPGSIQETPFGVIFLSLAGVAVFNGAEASQIISDDIHDEIEKINFAESEKFCSIYDEQKEIYELHVCQGTATENNRVLMYNLREAAWSVGRAYRPASSYWFNGSDRTFKKYIGRQAGGEIIEYSDRNETTDGGQAISLIYRSPNFDYGLKNRRKKVSYITITARCKRNFVIDISIFCDFGQSPTFTLTGVDSETYDALYAASNTDADGAIYNSDVYGEDQTIKRIRVNAEGLGRVFSVEITESETGADQAMFDLLSIEVEATPLDK